MAPAFSSARAAWSTAASTSGWKPSPSISSSTNAMRSPSTPRSTTGSTGSYGDAIDVESIGSCPAMTSSSSAASLTDVANGPIWSSELANATRP